MKKTHNINIGNSIIHIEEDAYEMLTVYLNEVKQHFSKNADDFEIVTDIENRIAEMFTEKLAEQQKQAIGIEDVELVIQQMGSVKDFETSEEAAGGELPGPEYDPIKKLYRDTDQAMIAGVCAGLAHYLDVNVKWVRLFTFITILLFGSGILAYIIFWFMVPKAKTRAEKMEMRGEETNLKGFANSYLQPFAVQSRGFVAEFLQVVGGFLQGSGRVIFKIIAGTIVFFGSIFLLALVVVLAAFLGFWNSDVYSYFPINIVNEEYLVTLTLAVFVILAIPLLALILFSVRVAFNGRSSNRVLSYGLLVIWLAGVVTGIFYVAKISSEFKEGAEFAKVTPLKSYPVYALNIDRARIFTQEDSLNYRIDANGYKDKKILNDLDDDFNMPESISFRMEKSMDGKVSMNTNYKSRGKTFEIALKNAQNIHYDFLQADSSLNFSPTVHIPKKANWRGQQIELVLNIPVGTEVKISNKFAEFLGGYNYWDCKQEDDDEYTIWVMTDSGVKCKYERLKKEN
ncbi:PspC domain-containing protein [Pedobacter nyackensis]|uniref:Phage shock protein C (PspC) family protein n=1 Tax=Pedobacter nyackensis TaxID=475255 RepID=A0A1W2B8T8_9SPHI|nr:PspC domain-containing protein [Pedobacter nyackensis]SMC69433.1 phage shock protein C (PspC) family protein [Pedobacter nyackensis]